MPGGLLALQVMVGLEVEATFPPSMHGVPLLLMIGGGSYGHVLL